MNNRPEVLCARCSQSVAQERLNTEVVVCNHCGFTNDHREIEFRASQEKAFVKFIAIVGIVLITGFIHLVEWDQHFFTIIPLKMKQMVGLASNEDLRKIVQICEVRLRHSCVQQALADLGKRDPKDADVMLQLGEILRKTGQTAQAVAAYKEHFNRGGNSSEAAYQLAKIYEFSGQYNEAKEYYSRALLARPEVLQVTVIQNYVDMLIKLGESKDARGIIEDVRKKNGPSAHYFMAKEYDSISSR